MSKCRSCGAEIIWEETKIGKKMPINADDGITPHWATCPEADKFRKNNKEKDLKQDFKVNIEYQDGNIEDLEFKNMLFGGVMFKLGNLGDIKQIKKVYIYNSNNELLARTPIEPERTRNIEGKLS